LNDMTEVTRLLSAMGRDDPQAAEKLLPLVYDELRKLAAQKLAQEGPGQTLQPTALVHEAYLRLVGTDAERGWDGRGHFFAAAAEAMRRILVDNARRKRSLKRGGGLARRPLDEALLLAPDTHEDVEALDEALRLLAAKHPLKARLVELRFFAGLTAEQAARCLGISTATAERHWAFARAWLYRKMSPT
jgi:RNA polymerase sigma factor (TIGR02999 family)